MCLKTNIQYILCPIYTLILSVLCFSILRQCFSKYLFVHVFCVCKCASRQCSSSRWRRSQRAAFVCDGEASVVHGLTVWSGDRLQVGTTHQASNMLNFTPSAFFREICWHDFFLFVDKGRNVETVEVAGDSEFHTLTRLQVDTEYIVTVIPLYEGNTEGPVATARFKIGKFGLRSVSQNQTFPCSLFPVFSTLFPENTHLHLQKSLTASA